MYLIWQNEVYEQVKKDNPNKNHREIAYIIGKKFTELPETKIAEYTNIFNKKMEEYEQLKEAYEKEHGHLEKKSRNFKKEKEQQ